MLSFRKLAAGAGFLYTQGLAHCFEKGDDGKLTDRFVIEPITANSLECMANGEHHWHLR